MANKGGGLGDPTLYNPSQNVADSNIFFYVMLTLVFLLAVLSIILAIVAYVKATGQLVGPQGPQGPEGDIPITQLFEQPAIYVSDANYNIKVDPLQQKDRFIVFTNTDATQVEVFMPPASAYSGKIFRFYNLSVVGGVLLRSAASDSSPVPAQFNPILRGYFAMVISDGGTQWVINSSTVQFVPTSAPPTS